MDLNQDYTVLEDYPGDFSIVLDPPTDTWYFEKSGELFDIFWNETYDPATKRIHRDYDFKIKQPNSDEDILEKQIDIELNLDPANDTPVWQVFPEGGNQTLLTFLGRSHEGF